MLHGQVGLYTLPEGLLLASGMDPAEFPAVGASPDGVICHRLPVSAAMLTAARAKLHSTTACSPTSPEALSKMAMAAANALLLEALQSVSPTEAGKPASRYTSNTDVFNLPGTHTSSTAASEGVKSRNGTADRPWLPLDDRCVGFHLTSIM